MGGFGPLSMLLFWGLLITGVIFPDQMVHSDIQKAIHTSPRDASSPLDIIKKRYARGEIDQEEFKRMQQALGKIGIRASFQFSTGSNFAIATAEAEILQSQASFSPNSLACFISASLDLISPASMALP